MQLHSKLKGYLVIANSRIQKQAGSMALLPLHTVAAIRFNALEWARQVDGGRNRIGLFLLILQCEQALLPVLTKRLDMACDRLRIGARKQIHERAVELLRGVGPICLAP